MDTEAPDQTADEQAVLDLCCPHMFCMPMAHIVNWVKFRKYVWWGSVGLRNGEAYMMLIGLQMHRLKYALLHMR